MALIDNYTKEELQEIVDKSTCLNDVIHMIGYATKSGNNNDTVKKRLQYYNISTEHFHHHSRTNRTFENVFCVDSTASQITLRRWYKKISNYTHCKICGISNVWNGNELTMILDHINGDNHDNRIENLRWICPNCDSQLPTFAGRNIKASKTREKSKNDAA